MYRFSHRFAGALWVLLLLTTACLQAKAQDAAAPAVDDARELIRSVVAAYKNANTYESEGEVISVETRANGAQSKSTLPFSIAFQRPDLLRVEWSEDMPYGGNARSVLSADGKEILLWMGGGNLYFKPENLTMGIAAATGVSRLAANSIPTILLESHSGGFTELSVMKELTLLPDEDFEGTPCRVLSGKDPIGKPVKYWIGREDHLLRCIERVLPSVNEARKRAMKSLENSPNAPTAKQKEAQEELLKGEDATRTTRQIHRKIRVNAPIASEKFQFTLPAGAVEKSLKTP